MNDRSSSSHQNVSLTPKTSDQEGRIEPAVHTHDSTGIPKKRNLRRVVVMTCLPLALIGVGGWTWLNGGRYEETDNAYVHQPKVSISSDISGRIVAVNVTDNQVVRAGDILFKLDPRPFQIALDEASAALEKARIDVGQLKVTFASAQADLTSARSTLAIQQESFDRQEALVSRGIGSASILDQPKLALQQAKTAVVSSEQKVQSAKAALGGDPGLEVDAHPSVRSAMAQVDLAKRNLDKTTVLASLDGVVSQATSLNVGQFVTAGSTIASMFGVGSPWVEANFKETQLNALTIGMPVEVKLDAVPDRIFEGTIASVSAATGAEFALVPAQNATGNWVKVVQRIPVRIDFDDEADAVLTSGMSAAVSVDTGKSTLDRIQGR